MAGLHISGIIVIIKLGFKTLLASILCLFNALLQIPPSDSLNCFFARFDDQNDNGAYSEIKQDGRAIVLKYHQVRSSQASEKLELNIIQPLLRKAQTCRTALVLSPLLYSLYTHDCVATHSSNVIVKFADDTTVAGLTTDYEESLYHI